ncbi:anthranilate synthase component I family protein [Tumebacillus sp. DT12]|uniref:Anthranilate synthase component 1 n=1 Tax=Tumebacillus lacus TaxID=2995335 RepID=A0ABT3X220_9BACL|nr:anthranilate synthase component I family protein [Tumebacillus lacus]MCX7570965.1 anthranilate synthase component I family protein [Tumebacillus lacus]
MSAYPSPGKIPVRTHHRTYRRICESFEVFQALTKEYGMESAFLLDSVKDIHSRYCASSIALFPQLTVKVKGRSLALTGPLASRVQPRLEEIEPDLCLFTGSVSALLDGVIDSFDLLDRQTMAKYSFGFVGHFSYDSIRYFEQIPKTTADDLATDDIRLQVHQVVLHFEQEMIHVIINEIEGVPTPSFEEIEAFIRLYEEPEFEGYDAGLLHVEEDVQEAEFLRRVDRAKEYIREGDVFQVVISKRNRIVGKVDSMQMYCNLKKLNPSPYMYYVDYGDYKIFGTSPEMQIRLEQGVVQMRPIAGTSKGKGTRPEENIQLIERLRNDEKERAEHLMLIDLCRNDLGRVSVPGSIYVKDFMIIEEYSHVYHMVSTVEGRVETNRSLFDIFLSTFPAGTLTGTPKVRAMEIIDELEDFDRGPYGGVLGFIDFLGNMNTAIVIRTIVQKGDTCYLQAGAGIVADSDPLQEWQETDHKLGALRVTALKQAAGVKK